MFDHVGIRVADRDASERFYATVLATLGIEQTTSRDWLAEWDDFALSPATPDKPVTHRLHIAFVAPSRAHVDEFWQAGMEAGYRDDGGPGPRPQYRPEYYGAFLLDPDGNSAEAVHHDAMRTPGNIDHLWIRVANLAAAKGFYECIAPHAGLRLGTDTSERVQFRGASATFSLVPGTRTENLHMAFPATDDATVDAFHRAATGAGYRDNGAPGERPEYHAGYYGAFVLDPDGTNVEVVNHNQR
jgi:catechol 2,3-dioxygenase-like lactoylglutathione lyase family enzyme